ncbi:hypothetical protein OH807_29405 [Kitasatospora sp. NBC_01560]|uniref:hypothetical protein n=1 Tax=Kitasatospora sp. NBC_01560 TaxID=2975965 RepID=UPI0038670C51
MTAEPPGADVDVARTLLALRRYVAAPLPGTALRLCGFVHSGRGRVRLYLSERADAAGPAATAVDLPTRLPGGTPRPPWWYVGLLRELALLLGGSGGASPPGAPADPFCGRALDAGPLLAAGLLPDEAGADGDDALDYVIADLVGDPLWSEARATVAPELYTVTGFVRPAPGAVRVYLGHDGRTIGVDLATSGADGTPRIPGWWAAAKLVAILNPMDAPTLEARRATDRPDPYCEAVYDLTTWA